MTKVITCFDGEQKQMCLCNVMEEISTRDKLHDEEKPLRCLERSQHVGKEPALRIYWFDQSTLKLFNLHSEPMARISLSSMQMSAQSWLRTSFLLTDLMAQSWPSDFLSAKITCGSSLLSELKDQTHSYLAITTSTKGGFEIEPRKINLNWLLLPQLWSPLPILLNTLLMNLILVKTFGFFLLEILNNFDKFGEVYTACNCA